MLRCADCEGKCFEYVTTCYGNLHREHFSCHIVWCTWTEGISSATYSDTSSQRASQLSRGLIHMQRGLFSCHVVWYTCTETISVATWSDTSAQRAFQFATWSETTAQKAFQLSRGLIHMHREHFSRHEVWYTCTDGISFVPARHNGYNVMVGQQDHIKIMYTTTNLQDIIP